jgi:plastocyanin
MKAFVKVVAIAILCAPFLANAQSSGDISAQAQQLLQQILLLQQQLGVGSGTTVSAGVCLTAGKTLKPGSSGADVTKLQQFLSADASIYPEKKVTGYYGSLTVAAVQRWQVKNNIVSSGSPSTTGYGSVGPRTLAAMIASCGGGGIGDDDTVSGFINVSPLTGNAPHTVTVEATVNTAKSCTGAMYAIHWGDNSQPETIALQPGNCNTLSKTYTHTYTTGGVYSVKLSSGIHESVSTVVVNGTSATGTQTGTQGGTQTGTQSGTTAGDKLINITANGFSPTPLTIPSGTKVTWKNTDTMDHTVNADNGSYMSGTLAPGATYSLTFSIKGEYSYFCLFHGGSGGSGMAGKIIVN